MNQFTADVAIVGSGPTALMAAEVISRQGYLVKIFEKRPGPSRKLFIAGSSGLNISNSLPLDKFIQHFSGDAKFWSNLFATFSPQDWLTFIADLGLTTFEGTSGRYFVSTMNAAQL